MMGDNMQFDLDTCLAEPAILRSTEREAIGCVGVDLPVEVLLASGRPFGHLPWRSDGLTPWADQWLESGFPGWARSIFEQWHAGAFDHLAHVVFSRADDASQRLFYYVRELQRRGQLGGPATLVFDIAHVRRESSLAHTAAAVLGLAGALDVTVDELPAGIDRANRLREAMLGLQGRRAQPGPWFEKLARAALWSDASRWIDNIAPPGAIGATPSARRILLAGSFPPDGRLHHAVEQGGACVVAEVHVHGLLRLGPPVPAQDVAPEQLIARALTEASTAPRAFLDRGALIVERACAAQADAVILWLTREDEALAWQLPAMRRSLQEAGITTLELAATQWLAPAAVLERIAAFCRETSR
jgi:hypothetical protein